MLLLNRHDRQPKRSLRSYGANTVPDVFMRRSRLKMVLVLLGPLCSAFPSYQRRIPNGDQVGLGSGDGMGSCDPVGHMACSYPLAANEMAGVQQLLGRVGEHVLLSNQQAQGQGQHLPPPREEERNRPFVLNQFGSDFLRIGKLRWTQALCELDSDGDGYSNGLELGDPCCLWKDENFLDDHVGRALTTTQVVVGWQSQQGGTSSGEYQNSSDASARLVPVPALVKMSGSPAARFDPGLHNDLLALPFSTKGALSHPGFASSVPSASDHDQRLVNFNCSAFLVEKDGTLDNRLNPKTTLNNGAGTETMNLNSTSATNSASNPNASLNNSNSTASLLDPRSATTKVLQFQIPDYPLFDESFSSAIRRRVGEYTAYLNYGVNFKPLTVGYQNTLKSLLSTALDAGIVQVDGSFFGNRTNRSTNTSIGAESIPVPLTSIGANLWDYLLYHPEYRAALEARKATKAQDDHSQSHSSIWARDMKILFDRPKNLHHMDVMCNRDRHPQLDVTLLLNETAYMEAKSQNINNIDVVISPTPLSGYLRFEIASADGSKEDASKSKSALFLSIEGDSAGPSRVRYSGAPYRFTWSRTVASFTPGGPGLKSTFDAGVSLSECEALYVNTHYVVSASDAKLAGEVSGKNLTTAIALEDNQTEARRTVGDGFQLTYGELEFASVANTSVVSSSTYSSASASTRPTYEDMGMASPFLVKNEPALKIGKGKGRYFLSKTCRVKLSCEIDFDVGRNTTSINNTCPYHLRFINYHGHYLMSEMHARLWKRRSQSWTDLHSQRHFNFNDQAYLSHRGKGGTLLLSRTTTSMLNMQNSSTTTSATTGSSTSSNGGSSVDGKDGLPIISGLENLAPVVDIESGDIIQAACVWDTRAFLDGITSSSEGGEGVKLGFRDGEEMCIHLYLHTPKSTTLVCEESDTTKPGAIRSAYISGELQSGDDRPFFEQVPDLMFDPSATNLIRGSQQGQSSAQSRHQSTSADVAGSSNTIEETGSEEFLRPYTGVREIWREVLGVNDTAQNCVPAYGNFDRACGLVPVLIRNASDLFASATRSNGTASVLAPVLGERLSEVASSGATARKVKIMGTNTYSLPLPTIILAAWIAQLFFF
ncbi:unnamed protein product [Amoebophrya sp. A25]|nr:unnamed protein product [Amoebophrya sp. A25]|eukprot:GSA25T00002766001.1